jgi:glycosyl transferase, family 25
MNAYVINLDRATARWEHIRCVFEDTPFRVERVAAVDGASIRLPIPEFDERRFRRCHGRGTNVFEVACYLSHLKAMRQFLGTGDSHALICEDDLHPGDQLGELLESLMVTAAHWNVARLSGLAEGTPFPVAPLGGGYVLNVQLGRLKGCGAYLVDRKSARAFVGGLLPMWLPWDHAADREWVFGLRAVSVSPFPFSQNEQVFASAIQGNAQKKLPSAQRWQTTYPYQTKNEIARWCHRGISLVALRHHLSGAKSGR